MTSRPHLTQIERCLLAGMLGDAWGGPYEGQPASPVVAFPEIATISDDTQLVLATCEAIIQQRGAVEPARVAAVMRTWFEAGRFTGLGSSTLKALRDLAAGAHWALAGARGEFAAGAGAAMRVAPLAFFLDPARDRDRLTIRDVSRITHHSDEAYAGSIAIVAAIRECRQRCAVPASLLDRVASAVPDTAVRDRILEIDGRAIAEAVALGNSGHVVDAVPLALRLAVAHPASVADVIRAAVSAGGDTDTIAALAAQIVGVAGAEPPADLLDKIPDIARARTAFSELAAFAH